MIDIAIKIENRFRFATRDHVLLEDVGGEQLYVSYTPNLMSAEFVNSSLSLELEGDAQIPNIRVGVADPDRVLFDYLATRKIEAVKCAYSIIENGVIVKTSFMSMGDYSHAAGVSSIDLRRPESIIDTDYMKMFTPVTFQRIEIPEVISVAANPTWSKMPDPPWKIIAVDYRRTYYHMRRNSSDMPQQDDFTPVGMNQTEENPLSAYTNAFFGGNKKQYNGLTSAADFSDKIVARSFDRICIRHFYRPYHQIEVKTVAVQSDVGTVLVLKNFLTRNAGFTAATVGGGYDNSDSKQPLFDNFRSHYFDFVNNRFIATFTCLVKGVGNTTFVSGDSISSGTAIAIVGTGGSAGRTLIDIDGAGGTCFNYAYAQIDSSIGEASDVVGSPLNYSPEVIAYLISGFGASYWDKPNSQYFWLSGGNPPTSGNNPLLKDNLRNPFLSGIPSRLKRDPRAIIMGYTENLVFSSEFNFKINHPKKTIISPCRTGVIASDQINAAATPFLQRTSRRTMDRLFLYASGLVPDIDNDPDYSAGFMWLGQTGRMNIVPTTSGAVDKARIVTGKDFKLFNRYKIHAVHSNIEGPVTGLDLQGSDATFPSPGTVLELQIHNRPLDGDNDYAVNIYPRQGSMEIPDEQDIRGSHINEETNRFSSAKTTFKPYISDAELYEQKIELYQVDFYMSVLHTRIQGLTKAERLSIGTDTNVRFSLRNRRKGQRLDQILNFQTLVNDVSQSVTSTLASGSTYSNAISIEDQNSNIINNASERFAVCNKSEVVGEQSGDDFIISEYLFFHIPKEGGYASAAGVDVPSATTADSIDVSGAFATNKDIRAYTNKMSYRPTFNRTADLLNNDSTFDYGSKDASNYFMDSIYRIIHDAVPENAKDLGKFFPIVYGRVFRVPLLHVISNIALEENSESAGDDVYIYASHNTGVRTPHDIILEIDVQDYKNERESLQVQQDRQRSGILDQMIVTPFPTFLEGHSTILERQNGSEITRFASRPSKIYNPYHNLIEKRSLAGDIYYGIKLRGSEWEEVLQQSDKRFAIRNGTGSTPIYGTFDGYFDQDGLYRTVGGLIEHPMDIVRHFVRTYGRKEFAEDFIDGASCDVVKAATPNYRASIYMQDKMTNAEFATELCRQFGFHRGDNKLQMFFYLYNEQNINYNKPIIDKLNVLEGPVEETGGYQEYITEIIYKYDYNYSNSEYRQTIYLNAQNNKDLAKTAGLTQGRVTKEVEAKWVSDTSTAYSVARYMAKMGSSKRRIFKVTTRPVEGITFAIGDVVPVTIERLHLIQQPCIVVDVKLRQDSLSDLILVQVGDTLSDAVRAEVFVPDPIVIIEPPDEPLFPPVLVDAPVISGEVKMDQDLTSTTGYWGPDTLLYGYAFQWLRDGVSIAGATSITYTVVSLDINASITSRVTATNPDGSTIAVSNALESVWRPILVAKPDTLIWDALDAYCCGGVAIGSPVADLRTVNGLLLATQAISARRATRTATMLDFDGTDDVYVGEAIYADYFDNDQTYTAGANGLSGFPSEWFLQSTGGASNRHWIWANINGSTRNIHRTSDGGAEISGFLAMPQTQALVWTLGTPGSGELYNLTTSTTLHASVAPAAMIARPMTEWAIGGQVSGSLCCPAKLQHFAMDKSAWTAAELDIYRTCAVNAGAI